MKREVRILLVDEGHRWADFSQKLLSNHGYRVDVDSDPERALGRLSTEEYDIVILDSSVSQGNGLSILKRIHSEHPEDRVVVISASPSWREGKEAYLGGAIDYISKSFDEVRLLNALRGDLEKAPAHGFIRR